ncbi:MAG: ribonuclease HII [Coxiella sp. RIFCSPHIGHO2_12_FULL_42_15]|nr:MAG: ribonuclease HII [Coxiella sp. RIFCSPHIGHO2_12_FULL_42_15]
MSTGKIIAGVDEAGRGPLAGPVIAAAVILDPRRPISGLKDSKQLTEKRREFLFQEIIHGCAAYAVGRADVAEIDAINILQASLLAMRRAVLSLSITPDHVLVDGCQLPKLPYTAQAIIQGDATISCISAASIIAKVTRDREMVALDREFPQYGFAQHKGYGTKAHQIALHQHGASVIHRRTFLKTKDLPVGGTPTLAARCEIFGLTDEI